MFREKRRDGSVRRPKDVDGGEAVREEIKGYKLKTVNFWMLAIDVMLIIAFLVIISIVAGNYNTTVENEEKFQKAENTVFELQQDSDLLTECAQNYIITGQRMYMQDYCACYTARSDRKLMAANFNRDFASQDREVGEKLTKAMEGFQILTELDIRCLKLMSEAMEVPEVALPEMLRTYDLPVYDQELSVEEKKQKAHDLMFGFVYTTHAKKTKANFDQIWSWVQQQSVANQQEAQAKMDRMLKFERFLVFLLVLIMGSMFFFVYKLILAPLDQIISQLKAQKPVDTRGFYEMNYLADTYNDICRINAASKLELNQQANYDALTGILNRGSFNRMCEFLRSSYQPLAFLLIDVDVFKSINDNYGHEVGDRALVRVAKLLKSSFRNEDYTIRYGGDEFAVLMVGAGPSEKNIISQKIDELNEELMHPDPETGIPPFSLSVGVAFSPKGYSDELFQKADKAVYYTKSHGRCGYTFYQAQMQKTDSRIS